MNLQESKSRTLVLGLTGIGLAASLTLFPGCRTHQEPVASINVSISEAAMVETDPNKIHAALFKQSKYPSAQECGVCHQLHFNQWSTSPHAYAQLSPVFNTMQAAVTSLTNGTNADFCIRCHSPVGMALDEPIYTENKNRAQVSLEGVTCIVCHRVNGDFGKISGRFKLEASDIHGRVFGPGNSDELDRILEENAKEGGTYSDLQVEAGGEGSIPIHSNVENAFFLSESAICGTCHDVTSPSGFRLEEAFSEYKSSPAARNGVSCQDCHMSQEEGKVSSIVHLDSAAIMPDGRRSARRELTAHYFAGPDYSIIHPGIFPVHGQKTADFATLTEWQDFDLSWGSEEFEGNVPASTDFKHKVWESVRKRREAHNIIYGPNGQMAKLDLYRRRQLSVLREAYQVGEAHVDETGSGGIDFRIEVKNGTDGHNVPTGFIAERSLFLEVTVYDARGEPVFHSGDLDPNGDVRDLHSTYVHNGALAQDEFLFSLQSKFMVRLFRGGEREQVLPLNFSASPLLFVRPASAPVIATGRPPGARTHRVALPPNGRRWAEYSVTSEELSGHGPYTAKVRMIAGMVPVNLIEAIHSLGFDYGMNPRQVGDRVVAGRPLLWEGEFSLAKTGAADVNWNSPGPGVIDWWQIPEEPEPVEEPEASAPEPEAAEGEGGQ